MVFVAIVSIYCGSLPVVHNLLSFQLNPGWCSHVNRMSPNVKTNSNWIITSWFMTREEIEKRMDELARQYIQTRDPEIIKELSKLRLELAKMEKGSGS
jgi:hypothetical protein